MTLEEAAAAADVSKSSLSRTENALVPIKPPIVRALIAAYNTPEPQFSRLLELARTAEQRGWWQAYGDVLSDQVAAYIGFEAEARSIRTYEALLLPGLLQTERYAEAIFRGFREPHTNEELERRIIARMKRQDRLRDLDLWFIVEEHSLRRPTGGAPMMVEQLRRLLEVSSQRNVTLQVLPNCVGAHPGLDGSFSIFEFPEDSDPDLAYAETPVGEIWLDKPDELRRLGRTFDQLRAAALSTDASRQVVHRVIEELS
jgi:hypothetical protein